MFGACYCPWTCCRFVHTSGLLEGLCDRLPTTNICECWYLVDLCDHYCFTDGFMRELNGCWLLWALFQPYDVLEVGIYRNQTKDVNRGNYDFDSLLWSWGRVNDFFFEFVLSGRKRCSLLRTRFYWQFFFCVVDVSATRNFFSSLFFIRQQLFRCTFLDLMFLHLRYASVIMSGVNKQ